MNLKINTQAKTKSRVVNAVLKEIRQKAKDTSKIISSNWAIRDGETVCVCGKRKHDLKFH